MSSCQRLVKFALGGEKGRRGCEEGRVLGVFPCETWLRVVSLLAVNESCAALARCSTAFRGVGVLRSALLARMLALEPVRSLRGFAHDQQVVSSVSVSEHSGSASHAVQWTGPGGADQNTSTEITSNSWADPLLLHKHIDAFLRRALGDEPERYTDVFSEWVHYNPNLPDQELFELRDMWERKAGGARGRSVARDHVEWEGAYNRMSKELKRDLCLIWAVLGKMFPFTKQENAAWREARATRIVVNTKATPEFRGGSIAVHNDVGSGYKSKSRERMVHNADTIPKWNGTGHQGKGRRSSSSATSTPTLSAWTTAKSISTSPEFESDEFERDHCQNDATTPTKGGKGKRCNLRNNSTNRRANCRGSSRSSCIRNACHSEAPESDEEDYDTSDNRHVPPKSPKFSTSAPSSSTPTLTTKRKHSVPASAATILPPPAPTHSPSSTAVPIAIPPTTRSLSTSSTASSSTATLLDVPSPYFNPSTPSGMLLTPASPQPRSILRKISKTTPRDGLPPLSMMDIANLAPPFNLDGDAQAADPPTPQQQRTTVSACVEGSPLFPMDDVVEAVSVSRSPVFRPVLPAGYSSAGQTPILSRRALRLMKKQGTGGGGGAGGVSPALRPVETGYGASSGAADEEVVAARGAGEAAKAHVSSTMTLFGELSLDG